VPVPDTPDREGPPLQEWFRERILNREDELKRLYAYKAGCNQIMFVRDDVHQLVARHVSDDPEERYTFRRTFPPRAISSHTSKSMPLPVYEIELAHLGLRLTMRNNFYNWVVTVESERPVTGPFYGLIRPDETKIPHYYAEGFHPDWLFDPWTSGAKKFSTFLYGEHTLWAFLMLLTEHLRRPYLSEECRLYLQRAANDLDCAVQLGGGDEIAEIEARLDSLAGDVYPIVKC